MEWIAGIADAQSTRYCSPLLKLIFALPARLNIRPATWGLNKTHLADYKRYTVLSKHAVDIPASEHLPSRREGRNLD